MEGNAQIDCQSLENSIKCGVNTYIEYKGFFMYTQTVHSSERNN
jgi:hypothetical protein